ncbi:MAG: hypothetical protein C0493_12305 [Kytococcus sp.]|nr:hypothetical protein [Kytococcus sp.]
MPTMPSSPAHRALFISLVNDAALFPPAALPMADALHRHATHRAGRDADLVGPFLVGVPAVTDLLSALDAGAPVPPGIGLVARPGIPVEETKGAIRALRADPRVRLVSLDAGWYPGWRELDPGELPLHLEVGRRDRDAALDDIAAAHDIADVRAKFRTGATTTWAWPDAKELTDVLLGTARRYLPFVLTGGLHHAVRGEHTVAAPASSSTGCSTSWWRCTPRRVAPMRGRCATCSRCARPRRSPGSSGGGRAPTWRRCARPSPATGAATSRTRSGS